MFLMGSSLSESIKKKASDLGFQLCGIAKPHRLTDRESVLKSWCEAGMNDKMAYLARNTEIRFDPQAFWSPVKSIIVTGLSYNSDIRQNQPGVPVLSRYTYGQDYHKVIQDKLLSLLDYIKSTDSQAEGKALVDSGPFSEKPWAQEAGLGWQGKHSIVINKEIGSFFFIGILLLNRELDYDSPVSEDYCGECRLCIEACPTCAINENRTIDARKCIANLTIENRGPIPDQFVPKLGGRVYGCDRCQEVCPWNKKAGKSLTPEFEIIPEIAGLTIGEWLDLSEDRFNRLFKDRAVGRVKYHKFKENIKAAVKSL